MAVFTQLTEKEVGELLESFSIGTFVALEPIASGIENTNYFLDTTAGRWVLTVFERLKREELPFYLELAEHLYKKGCPVACPERLRDGTLIGTVCGKPCSIANRLAGSNVEIMGVAECRSMGTLLAQMHKAVEDFKPYQPNLRGLDWWVATAPLIEPHVPAELFAKLSAEIAHQVEVAKTPEFKSLADLACHCDLFRNNSLIANGGTEEATVAGVFDFYFAGCTPRLYDLAVTMNDWCVDPATGRFIMEKAQAFIESYDTVAHLTATEKALWRDMLRAAALRFWVSRLYDFYLPREASLLKPHDPAHFERVLADRQTCELPWPKQ